MTHRPLFPSDEEDDARRWEAEEARNKFQAALEQIATGRGTGLHPEQNLAVCREIAEKALESVLGERSASL